ncbi:MAG TPA: hypothetical protein DEP46_12580 [Blastocatellia bacterium]|nr:hypothetical protein [Blastocatellia bacterium]
MPKSDDNSILFFARFELQFVPFFLMTLKFTDISKRYGNRWALRDVSFEAEPGRVVGVYGLNGAGKTSLLRIAAGVEEVNSGTIERTSAYFLPTFPEAPLLKRLRGVRADTAELAATQSAMIDEALKSDAKLLCLDDPFRFFDAGERRQAMEKLRIAARDSGKLVLFATNSFEQILGFADDLLVLVGGYLGQYGPASEVYNSPLTAPVASVTGRCNIFEARRLTSSKTDLPEFHTIEGGHRLFTGPLDRTRLGPINKNIPLAIRPEYISLSFGASFPEDNLLKAIVTEVSFLGPMTLVRLDAGGLELEALVLRLIGLNVGEECMVGLPPNRITVLS